MELTAKIEIFPTPAQKDTLWKLSDRIMECDCGNHIDRDINSAINIMNWFLSQNALVAGLGAFALKLRQTGLLNDNDGSALAGVPYAGGDTAGFAGGENPPVRVVYKWRNPLCHVTVLGA